MESVDFAIQDGLESTNLSQACGHGRTKVQNFRTALRLTCSQEQISHLRSNLSDARSNLMTLMISHMWLDTFL